MTSVSSDVTMIAFEPVLAACNACIRKRVSASSCVDCNSATSTHLSVVILKQVSFAGYYYALPCSIHMYHCSFHSPTNNLMRLVSLKELHRKFLHCCMFSVSESLMDGWRYASKTTSTLPLCTPTCIQYHGQDRLCQLCTCFAVAVHLAVHPVYQTHPINDVG